MDLKLNPKKIASVLAFAMILLAILHIIACLPLVFMDRSYPLGFLSLDGENNLPAMFSVALLWCSALLTACIAWAGGKNRIYWAGLSLAFLLLGLDEATMIHERMTEITRQVLGATGLFYFAWVIPYLILLLLFGALYCRFFFALPSDTRWKIMWSVLLFVGGAIGVEMLGGAWLESHGRDSIFYLFVMVEEVLEMSGSIAFIYTFSSYIARHLPDLRLRIASN